jgi:site-specific DNA recombinase
LWQAVQARQSSLAKLYGGNHRGLLNRSASSGNLLTGFLKCGLCGANLVIVTGRRRRHAMYGCPQHWYRGACTNKLRIRQGQLEPQLLSGLQEAVLQPDAFDYVLQELQRQLEAAQADTSVRQARSRERKRELQQQLDRLTAAVAEGGHSSFLLDAISERERELAELEASAALTENRIPRDPEKLRQSTLERLSRLPELLSLDVSRARAELGKHVGQITLAPAELNGRPNYICQGDWNLLGTLGDVRMVAGGGFEPPTFGL